MKRNSYIEHLRADTELIALAAETGPLDSPVASCPDWDLRALVAHTGNVHRFAQIGINHNRPPQRGDLDAAPESTEGLVEWFRAGAASLADLLETGDPAAPAWHPFPSDQVAGFWARRQAHENAVHRWDAQSAVGTPDALDPELSSDGLGEIFDVLIPRLLTRGEAVELPTQSLHLHCTDIEGEWLVWNEGGEYAMVAEHRKGDAALRGSAADLLLVMTHRMPVSAVDVVGDPAAADAWLALPGL